jgi:hypothetical protein
MRTIGIFSWGIAFAMLCAGSQVAHADFLYTAIQPNTDLSNDQVIQGDTSQSASPTLVMGTGEYVLKIAGVATSAGGGSHTAGIGVTAVPLPAALPLLPSGMAGSGAMARRRRVSLA